MFINMYTSHKHFFSRFSSNSEAYVSELLENLEKCFLCTTCKVMYLTNLRFQPHIGVVSVAKGSVVTRSPLFTDVAKRLTHVQTGKLFLTFRINCGGSIY